MPSGLLEPEQGFRGKLYSILRRIAIAPGGMNQRKRHEIGQRQARRAAAGSGP